MIFFFKDHNVETAKENVRFIHTDLPAIFVYRDLNNYLLEVKYYHGIKRSIWFDNYISVLFNTAIIPVHKKNQDIFKDLY